MTFNVISTGSKGNAVIFNKSLMVDCGVSFKSLTPYYKDLKIILLTHIHGDHFNKSTIKKIAFEKPILKWICADYLVKDLIECGVNKRNIILINQKNGIYISSENIKIETFDLVHNVPNIGYKLYLDKEKILYATDTNELNVEAKDFDYYFLEANYTEEEIKERIEAKETLGLYCYEKEVLKNHLSKEKTDDFLLKNAGYQSKYVYLHGHQNKEVKYGK